MVADAAFWGTQAALGLAIGLATAAAFLLGVMLFGNVLMGGNPAAVRRLFILGEHDTAVARLHVMRHAGAFADAVEDALAIGVDVAGEQAGLFPVLDQLAQRAARLHHIGRQFIHVDVALIAQHDAPLRIEHA